jgi:hypothetical protein
MKAHPFNYNPSAWEPVRGLGMRQGFEKTCVTIRKAFLAEPNMPAEDEAREFLSLLRGAEAAQIVLVTR